MPQSHAEAGTESASRMFSVSNWRMMRQRRGTEGTAHGDLGAASDAAGELKVGNIGADDQQDKQRGAHDELVIERRQVAVDLVEQEARPWTVQP